MVLNKTYQALESIDTLNNKVLKQLPESLLEEMEAFARRNSLHKNRLELCERCLKAFALQKNADVKAKRTLEKAFNCETGHNGFYLDKKALKRFS